MLVFREPSESVKLMNEDLLLLFDPLNASFAAIDDVVEDDDDFLEKLGFSVEDDDPKDLEKSKTCG